MTHLDAKIEALKLISPEWRGAFVAFIETGEASPEFLAHLEQNPAAQQACEAVLRGDRLLSEALVRRVLAVVAGPVRITPSLAGQDRVHWSVEYQRFIRTPAGTTELVAAAVFAWSQAEALAFVLAKEAERDAALLAYLKAREAKANDDDSATAVLP